MVHVEAWGHVGLSSGHVGVMLGPSWGHLGGMLRTCSGHVEKITQKHGKRHCSLGQKPQNTANYRGEGVRECIAVGPCWGHLGPRKGYVEATCWQKLTKVEGSQNTVKHRGG